MKSTTREIEIELRDSTPSHITNGEGYYRLMNFKSNYGQRYLKTPHENRWMQWSDIDRNWQNFFNDELKEKLDRAFTEYETLETEIEI